MKQTTRLIIALAAALLCLAQSQAQTIHRKKDTARPDSIEKVIVQGDTVDIIIPEANYGRFDRGLYNYIFIPKGNGASASRHRTANSRHRISKYSQCCRTLTSKGKYTP